MAVYYCHDCARKFRFVLPVDPTALTANTYQLEKYIKHTAPSGIYPRNSVFHDNSWSSYQNYMVTTTASGCLEIDDGGRRNLIFYAGKETGLTYDHGLFAMPCSGVKVVCSEDFGRIHAFPSDFHPESQTCASCGKLVPFDPR